MENLVQEINRRMMERASLIAPKERSLLSNPALQPILQSSAVELAALQHELRMTKGRLVQRLAESLLPECWIAHSPGVMVIRAPRNLRTGDSLELELKLDDETRFIPSWRAVEIVDAEIAQQEVSERDRALLLGIQVKDLEVLFGAPIFFQIAGTVTDSSDFFRLLPFTQWTYQDRKLQTITRPYESLMESPISKGEEILHVYDHRFVKILGFCDAAVPEISENPDSTLPQNAAELKWLRIDFPASISPDVLTNIKCHLNCIPVVNLERKSIIRKLEHSFQTFELNDHNNFFVGIDEVVLDPNGKQETIPFHEYTVRRSGIAQFDDLDAKEKILDTLHSTESEFQAYRGIEDYRSELAKLYDTISGLKKRLDRKGTARIEAPVFLQFNEIREIGEIEINYFSTDGELETALKMGDRLECKGGPATVMTDYYHAGLATPEKQVEQLKHQITSRGRIVTKADIVSACYAFFGSMIEVEEKDIRKGATISPNPAEGLVDCIHVTIRPKPEANMRRMNWEMSARQLEMYLHENSPVGSQFKVSVALDVKSRN